MASSTIPLLKAGQGNIAQNWVQKHPLISFFTGAYVIAYVAYFAYLAFPILPFEPFWLVAIFSPTISAVIVAGLLGGIPEIKHLLSGLTRWRVGWKWYLAATSLMLGALALALGYIALGNTPRGVVSELTVWGWIAALGYTLLSGPLSEEPGWRGFALPRLQEKHSALTASLVVGIFWAFWHVPIYFLPFGATIPFVPFIGIAIGLSILFAWLYNNTRGSLVIVILAHFSFNFSGAWIAGSLGLLPPMVLYIGGAVMIMILVLLIIVLAGPRNLSRKPVNELPFRRTKEPRS
jgi:membrane protease YdiL (CAAX protease family)